MEAQDAERQKIERNLHDGAQQQLIALTIHLGLLEESADDPAAVTELVAVVKNGIRAALDDLRDLARGIYGTGFDTATTRYGTGLQGMADRLAALGGALQIRSQPGHGTILSGELPLPRLVTD